MIKRCKNFLISSRMGGIVLKFMYWFLVWRGKSDTYDKYKLLRFLHRNYTEKRHYEDIKEYRIINKGIYKYKFFNICYLNDILANIAFSISENVIPVVNVCNIDNGINIWEQYFRQPFITVKQIDEKAKVDWEYNKNVGFISPCFFSYKNDVERSIWMKLYKDYVSFNDEVQEYVDDEYNTLISGKRVLGVLCRGTDYIATKPKGHPVQPELSDVIADVRKVMKDYKYDYIYLATEEKRIHDLFENEFPGYIIINKRTYYDEIYYSQKAGSLINSVSFDRENDEYLKGLEYLSSMYILSKCNSMLAGNCGGSQAAYYMNNGKYEYVKLYDLGIY